MSDKEYVLDTLRRTGLQAAQTLQAAAGDMTGTALNAEAAFIPGFAAAKARQNMLTRPAGFVCRSSAGRVVKLLQPYDSEVYPGEPEELPAQWGFVWSDDPAHARPFVAMATSPYMTGNVCEEGDRIYRSLMDNNVHAPSAYQAGWEEIT